MRAPPISISTTPQALAGGVAISNGLVCADEMRSDSPAVPPPLSAPIWIGTKLGALPATAAATCRRQTVSSPPAAPLRRATSEMLTSVSKLSATIRAFSSAVYHRRPRCPVITSMRRYESPSCLASSMAFAIVAPPPISSCQAVSQANLAMARWGPHAGYHQPRRR